MSAAEKLKALQVRYETDTADLPDYGPEDEYATLLVNALPQIVAVVGAAETIERVDTIYPGDIVNLRSALVALDESLSGSSPSGSETPTAP